MNKKRTEKKVQLRKSAILLAMESQGAPFNDKAAGWRHWERIIQKAQEVGGYFFCTDERIKRELKKNILLAMVRQEAPFNDKVAGWKQQKSMIPENK